jgi:hypothetical protein
VMCYSLVCMTETFSRGQLYSCVPHDGLTNIPTIHEGPHHVLGNQFYCSGAIHLAEDE